ncbi:MAG TPA: transglycosylase SLT domain-containing protein [Saprospiraceae bacterium]|nr:transglycosylase SLT domain-containing protein [Saprospiraceae bacterium]HMQ84749.1 transglycosylase SLT domain-containing protein [Saprospiraceae bacterium]
MNIPCTLVAVLVASSLLANGDLTVLSLSADENAESRWSSSMESDIKTRVAALDLPFKPYYDQEIADYIKDYAATGYRETEKMLGATSLFFPVFEHELQLKNLPDALKYLPIVETGLQNDAVSHAGAAGLWQFVPTTARQYKLKVNSQVDERFDVYRASAAAAELLSRLYAQYKDWRLVLAAYNCGPVRVNQAIQEAGCRTYSEVKEHLPLETRQYLPRYIAAAYIAANYHYHDLQPEYPDSRLTQLRVTPVFNAISLGDVAFHTDLDIALVKQLNPAFKNDLIPSSETGHLLVLPAKEMKKFKGYLQMINGGKKLDPVLLYPGYHVKEYIVQPGDSIESLAKTYKCEVQQIMDWNSLKKAEVYVLQEVRLFLADASPLNRP